MFSGVYRDATPYKNWIDVNGVAELSTHALTDDSLTVGINMQLSQLIVVLQQTAQASPSVFHYTAELAKHIALVANVPVRNVCTRYFLSIRHHFVMIYLIVTIFYLKITNDIRRGLISSIRTM